MHLLCFEGVSFLEFLEFGLDDVEEEWWVDSLHEDEADVDEERESWDDHEHYELEGEDVLDEAEVEAEEMMPDLASASE